MEVIVFRGVSTRQPGPVRAALKAGQLNRPGVEIPHLDLASHHAAVLQRPSTWPDVKRAAREVPITFVCGDFGGAAHYACRDGGTSLVVELRVNIERLVVDCRDFLCTVIQGGTDGPHQTLQVRSRELVSLFGDAIEPYFWAATRTTEQSERIGLCNAAAHDPAVVHGHLKNTRVIGGRYGTRFRSAFALRLPVDQAAVVRIHDANLSERVEDVEVSIDAFRP